MNKKLTFLLAGVMVAAAMPALTACPSSMIDYVGQMKLSNYYSGTLANKNFLDNGIGYATFKKHIDGDTTHFFQTENNGEPGRVVKSRYIGVDTPESTGQIEAWGKKASHFTEEKVTTAKSIILTTDVTDIGKVAAVDSTGSRFKTLVWITDKENATLDDYRCLNLWLVQEGWSTGKGLSGSPLTDYFTKADLQAQEKKLHIWSGADPDFDPNAPAVTTSLSELAETYLEEGAETSWAGAKVRVTGIVTKLSGDYDCYIQETDTTTGSTYGLYVFAGYKSYSPMRTLGNKIEIVGTYTLYMGNPQLTGVSYQPFIPDPANDMRLISTGNSYTIETKGVTEIQNRASINMIYTVNGLTIYRGYTEIDATTQKASGALTFYAKDANDNELQIRVPDDVFVRNEQGQRVTDWEYFNGKTVNVTGTVAFFAPDEANPNEGRYQLKLCHTNDFVVVE